MRYLAIVVGTFIISAATHVTILATGGYASSHAPLAIAIACGVGIGSLCIGRAWSERRWPLALFIALALLAGEAWAMLSTAERIIAARELAAEPAKILAINRRAAEKRLADAQLVAEPASQRLETALEAKRAADAAVASEASKKGCASNCRALLTKAVDDAAAEVQAARRESEIRQQASAQEIAAAKAALEALPAPKSETPLADKIGWQGWALDLLAAALASLSANGLGAALLAYGAHGRPHSHQAPPVPQSPRTIEAEFIATQAAKRAPAVVMQLPAPTNAKEHAAKFGLDCLQPSPGTRTPLSLVHAAYLDWCANVQTPPLPSAKIGGALAALFEDSGLMVEEQDGRLFVVGVDVAATTAQLPATTKGRRA